MRDAQWQNLTNSQLTLCSRVHGGCSKRGEGKELEGLQEDFGRKAFSSSSVLWNLDSRL